MHSNSINIFHSNKDMVVTFMYYYCPIPQKMQIISDDVLEVVRCKYYYKYIGIPAYCTYKYS